MPRRISLQNKLDKIKQMPANSVVDRQNLFLERKEENFYRLTLIIPGGTLPISEWMPAKEMSKYLDGFEKGLGFCG